MRNFHVDVVNNFLNRVEGIFPGIINGSEIKHCDLRIDDDTKTGRVLTEFLLTQTCRLLPAGSSGRDA